MAISAESKLEPVHSVNGIDNRTDESKLPAGFVRKALNVDLGIADTFSRRAGYTKRLPTAEAHSLWGCPELPFALFVDAGELKAYWGGDSATSITPVKNRDMSYAFVAGRVYYSNGADTGCVYPDGTAGVWGVERPGATFSVMAVDGALSAGRYQVTLTYLTHAREESGAPESVFVDVPHNGGIRVFNIPVPASSAVVAARLYISPCNGEKLFHRRDVAAGIKSATYANENERGKPLDTQFLAPMPPAQHLLAAKGRIFAASGRHLIWSDSLRYGQYHETQGYMAFGEHITALAVVPGERLTMFVGTSCKTYVLTGGAIESVNVAIAAHKGVVEGSAITVSSQAMGIDGISGDAPLWLATNGVFYLGTRDGQLLPLREKNVSADVPTKAASTVIERNGLQQALVAYRNGRNTGLGVSDKAVARVYDRGAA